MNTLTRLLGLEFPDDATVSWGWPRVTTLPGWWLVGLLMAGGLALSIWLYRRERDEVSRGRRVAAAILRGAALALLVFMVARPELPVHARGTRPRDLIVLIDNSASMRQTDRRLSAADLVRVAIAKGIVPIDADPNLPQWQSAAKDELANISRADIARAVLDNASLDLMGRLGRRQPVKAYLFGDKSRRVSTTGLSKAITADEGRTAIADALVELATKNEGGPPAAIVLITDGVETANRDADALADAAAKCRNEGVAVHVFAIGSTDSGAARITSVAAPETLFLNDVASIPVRWRYVGSTPHAAVLSISLDGNEVARKEVMLQPNKDGGETMSLTPEKRPAAANPELTVSLRIKDDPAPADEFRKPVAVSERRVRVLVVDDSPRWEFKFLQPALSRDRRVEATYVLAQGDPRAVRSEPFLPSFPARDKLFTYDLVILGDVGPAVLGIEGMLALVDYVQDGGGLAIVAGRRHMPADFADTPLAEVLPVEFTPTRFPVTPDARTLAFQPMLTPVGRRSEMLSLGDTPEENDRIWKELPGFYWYYPVTKLRPGAQSLLAHPQRKVDEQPAPLAAIHHFGKGQVLFLAVDETWRWRYNAGDRLYSRLWGQIAYQLGLPHLLVHGSRTQLTLGGSQALVGSPGFVYARLLDAEYRPYVTESVPAVLESLDLPNTPARRQNVSLEPIPGRPGEYRTWLPHDAPGRYELRVNQPEPGSLSYLVAYPPGHELEPAGLPEDILKNKLAQLTDGGYYREEDLHRLPDEINPRTAPFISDPTVILWKPLMLFIFVGLISAEWVVRKLGNMS